MCAFFTLGTRHGGAMHMAMTSRGRLCSLGLRTRNGGLHVSMGSCVQSTGPLSTYPCIKIQSDHSPSYETTVTIFFFEAWTEAGAGTPKDVHFSPRRVLGQTYPKP